MARRRESPSVKDLFEPLEDAEAPSRENRDPAEASIYLKQLKRALKFLPLGSRAYYYVSSEIVRANRELKTNTDSSTEAKRSK